MEMDTEFGILMETRKENKNSPPTQLSKRALLIRRGLNYGLLTKKGQHVAR